jgi:hypothetical protein
VNLSRGNLNDNSPEQHFDHIIEFESKIIVAEHCFTDDIQQQKTNVAAAFSAPIPARRVYCRVVVRNDLRNHCAQSGKLHEGY